MPSSERLHLLTFEPNTVDLIKTGDKVTYLQVGHVSYELQNVPLTNEIVHKNDEVDIKLKKYLNHYAGILTLNTGQMIKVFSPFSCTYQLQLSDQSFVKQDDKESDQATYSNFKTLKVDINLDKENSLTSKITLDNVHVDSVVYLGGISIENEFGQHGTEFSHMELQIDPFTDALSGFLIKNQDHKKYRVKGCSLNDHTSTQLVQHDSNLSLSDLISLTQMKDKHDVALQYAQEGFLTILFDKMDERYFKTFFSRTKVPLSGELFEISEKNLPGQATVRDFYRKYSFPLISKMLINGNHSEILDSFNTKPNIHRIKNYLEREVLEDVNYQNQNALLYKYGYKKAVPKVVSYMQDQSRIGYDYWAQRLFYHYSSQEYMDIVKNILSSPDFQKDSSVIKKIFNEWTAKMSVLQGEYLSKKLSTLIMMNAFAAASSPDNYLDEDLNTTFVADEQDRKAFLKLLEDLAKEDSDFDTIVNFVSNSVQLLDSLVNIAFICYSFKMNGASQASLQQALTDWGNSANHKKYALQKLIPEGKFEKITVGLSITAQLFSFGISIYSLVKGPDTVLDTVALMTNIIQVTLSASFAIFKMFTTIDFNYRTNLYVAANGTIIAQPTVWRKIVGHFNAVEPDGYGMKSFKYNISRPDGWIKMITLIGSIISSVIAGIQFTTALKNGDIGRAVIYCMIMAFSIIQAVFVTVSLFTVKGVVASLGAALCSSVIFVLTLVELFLPKKNEDVKAFSQESDMQQFLVTNVISQITKSSCLEYGDKLEHGDYSLQVDTNGIHVRKNGHISSTILSFDNNASSPLLLLRSTGFLVVETKNDTYSTVAALEYTKRASDVNSKVTLKLDSNGVITVFENASNILYTQ
ncbi:hypothetical protein FDP41_013055 [Naegleria fowleri]|uniref:Uncharacterized protein n=1 Tax=Naegleria fowleri TaxID=5763 RepID=A0A6A5C1A7_NAEFO|nr:uncharacterized protein FDP41_013055 [Naegleria fowleri]KAF0980572.1 hypothetical protein FDP41_013055 [Naegleria fowleri]